MPYGRRKKSYNKKRNSMRSSMYKIAKKVAYKTQPLKMYQRYLTTNFGSVGSTGNQLELSALLTQGDDYDKREGRSVYVTGVLLDGVIETGDTLNVLRVVLSEDAAGTILNYSLDTAINRIIGNTQKKYMDKQYIMNRNDSTDNVYRRIKKWIPVNRKLIFPATTGSSNSSLYLYMVSDSSVVPNPGFSYGSVQIFFKDS